MWTRQLLMTAAVPVYPGEQLAPSQRRCAGQLQQLTRRLVKLCQLSAVTAAAATDSASTEPAVGPKQTADAAVDAREQPGRIPPLPDLVQSCAAADTAGSRHPHHQQQQRQQQEQASELQQQEQSQRRRKQRDVVAPPAPSWPSVTSGQVTAAPGGPAAPSDAVREAGLCLRRCADQLQSSRCKRRAAPPSSPPRRSASSVSRSVVLLSVSALLLVCYCRRR